MDFIRDGLDLAGIGTTAEHEIVGEGCDLADVEYTDRFRLLGFSGVDSSEPERFGCLQLFRSAQVRSSPSGIVLLMSSLRVLLSAGQIQARIQELGTEIDRDYPHGPVYLIAILKGACFFLADLARAMNTPARIEFIGISSYGRGKTSSGEVKLTKDLDVSIEGHDVVIVEDIVDSGITLSYLMKVLSQRKPKSLRIASLLDKPERRQRPVEVHYVGFRIPDEFVVGFGLDYDEDYRNLRDVCVLSDS
jgi:hypoxanthine phosphoribosyltransferase